jgi:hypothetical protein
LEGDGTVVVRNEVPQSHRCLAHLFFVEKMSPLIESAEEGEDDVEVERVVAVEIFTEGKGDNVRGRFSAPWLE